MVLMGWAKIPALFHFPRAATKGGPYSSVIASEGVFT